MVCCVTVNSVNLITFCKEFIVWRILLIVSLVNRILHILRGYYCRFRAQQNLKASLGLNVHAIKIR